MQNILLRLLDLILNRSDIFAEIRDIKNFRTIYLKCVLSSGTGAWQFNINNRLYFPRQSKISEIQNLRLSGQFTNILHSKRFMPVNTTVIGGYFIKSLPYRTAHIKCRYSFSFKLFLNMTTYFFADNGPAIGNHFNFF